MLARASSNNLAAFLSFAVLAVATPWGAPPPPTTNPVTTTVTVTAPPSTTTIPSGGSCNTGPIQCCNTVEKASSPGASALLGLLDVVVGNLDVLVGLTCSPINVIGIGSGGCNARTVCCQNNSYGGLISIGCVPISL